MSCIYGGLVTGLEVARYIDTLKKRYDEIKGDCFEIALAKEQAFKHDLLSRKGGENIHVLHEELSDLLVANVTVVRNNEALKETIDAIKVIRERYKNITLDDHSQVLNQTYTLAAQFHAMLEISLAIAKGALLRNEFRGSHYKPEFPRRDDENWLKTTIALYDPNLDEPEITYEPVDIRHIKPVERKYAKTTASIPEFENVPKNILLPI
jgi:succinate dehydrogenase / fumarate reductase flavoprotein subunit